MSHYTVAVRIPAGQLPESPSQGDIRSALEPLMLPYMEYGSCGADEEKLKPYLEWQDMSEEIDASMENETSTYVVDSVTGYDREKLVKELRSGERDLSDALFTHVKEKVNGRNNSHYLVSLTIDQADGEKAKIAVATLRCTYDENYRVKGKYGLGTGTHAAPKEWAIEVPLKHIYKNRDVCARKYHGYKFNEEKGTYGYWHNPNGNWDYWVIGGRWSGLLTSAYDKRKHDYLRIEEIDFEKADQEMQQRFDKFKRDYRQRLAGEIVAEWGTFDSSRSDALRMDIVVCLNDDELTDEHKDPSKYLLAPWERQRNPKKTRYDVIKILSDEELEAHKSYFDPIATYARLTPKEGWVEPGKMGFFGMSNAEAGETTKYKSKFRKALFSGNQQDWVVIVDCHT